MEGNSTETHFLKYHFFKAFIRKRTLDLAELIATVNISIKSMHVFLLDRQENRNIENTFFEEALNKLAPEELCLVNFFKNYFSKSSLNSINSCALVCGRRWVELSCSAEQFQIQAA